MIKKKQTKEATRPQLVVLTPMNLPLVAGGDPPPTKIRDALVGD